MQKEITLESFRFIDKSNAYCIGLADKLVTIYSQQIRSICLARLLTEKTAHDQKNKIAIIGGGVSGLTVSLELLKLGWRNISIYERLPDLMAVQNGCDTRWVHPHIIDWPDDGSDEKKANIETLPWEASTASNVTYSMEKTWDEEVRKLIKSFRTSTNADGNTAPKKGRPEQIISINVGVTHIRVSEKNGTISIEWIRDSRIRPIGYAGSKSKNTGIEEFNHLILATGFGIEIDSRASYWRNEDIGQIRIDGRQQRYIVSGLGDGGISDLLRLTTKHFRPDRATSEIEPLKSLRDTLCRIKSSSPTDLLASLDEAESKHNKTRETWKKLFKHFQDYRREDTLVYLHHWKGNGFKDAFNNSPASFLNKLFLYILYKNGSFQFIDSSQTDSEQSFAQQCGIPPENIICRHGVNQQNLLKKFVFTPQEIALKEQPISECLAYLDQEKLKLRKQLEA